jgi:hypothetical protein
MDKEYRPPHQRRAFNRCLVLDGREGMGRQPQHAGGDGRIHPASLHHTTSSPQRWPSRWCPRQSGTVNSSLTLRPRARLWVKSQVVGIRWESPANRATVLGDRPDVLLVPDPPRLRQGEHALVDLSLVGSLPVLRPAYEGCAALPRASLVASQARPEERKQESPA